MADSLAVIFPVFALILIGWGAGRRALLPGGAVDALNGYVVRIALPLLLFQFVAEADWKTLWQPRFVLVYAAAMAIAFLLGWIVAPRGERPPRRVIDGLASAYANTAFMGIPIAHGLFGPTGLAAAVIASLLTVALLFAFSILLIETDLHRGRGWLPMVGGVAGSVLANPIVLGPSLGAAWALTGVPLPGPLHTIATLLGQTAPPVALVTIGLFLAAIPPQRAAGPALALLSLVKLIVQPLATFALAWLLGLPAAWTAAAVLIAAMPTGTGPFMVARLYGLDAVLGARVILFTTMLSAVTLPLLLLFL